MFPRMTELPLAPAQVVAATRLMLHIAHVDGAGTAEEVALIRQFYDASRDASADFPAFDTIEAGQGAGAVSARDFPDPGHRDMIIALCLMAAYADGELSAAERAAVSKVAGKLELSPDHVEHILAQIKDFMLSHLAKLPDAGSVAAVAKELG
jgi:uncharacterized tellurite resistance protein B-like protein